MTLDRKYSAGERKRFGRRGVTVGLALALMLAVALPATAHYSGFTGSITQDIYIPANKRRCLVSGGGNCVAHSYSFVSAGDVGGRNFVCAQTYNAGNHDLYQGSCGNDFVRHCAIGQRHDGGGLNCHDQDGNSYLHAGAATSSPGTTVRIHGTF